MGHGEETCCERRTMGALKNSMVFLEKPGEDTDGSSSGFSPSLEGVNTAVKPCDEVEGDLMTVNIGANVQCFSMIIYPEGYLPIEGIN